MNLSVGQIVPEMDLAAQGITVKEGHHDREVLAAVRPGYEIPVHHASASFAPYCL
jgi:hypothetical protein